MKYTDIKSTLKRELRKSILQKRDALSPGEQKRASVLITDRIAGHQWFYGCEYLLIFVSYGSEIDTKGIINEALHAGKKVFVPKVCGEELEFYRMKSLGKLQEGYKGIMEPDPRSEKFEYELLNEAKRKKTLLIMPGVAFDPEKNRLGYGKGFYDRFLAGKTEPEIRSIAIGHRCQLAERVPCEEHDLKPHQVILV